MSEHHLRKLIICKENIFSMNFEDFQKLFPTKWRCHQEVQHLYDAIHDKQQDCIGRVKENIEEAFDKVADTNEDCLIAEYVIEMMEELKGNLSKDLESLDEDLEKTKEVFMQYTEYFKRRSLQVVKANESLPKMDTDKQHVVMTNDDIVVSIFTPYYEIIMDTTCMRKKVGSSICKEFQAHLDALELVG